MIPDGLKIVFTAPCRYGMPGDIKTISYATANQLIIRRVAVLYEDSVHGPKLPPVKQYAFKVSAICPTYNRRRYLPSSIAQFLNQTFKNAELVIVDDSTESVRDIVPVHPRIQYIRSEEYIPTGAKRNLCCEKARGEIIVHWDDDDWQSPERIQDQVSKLERSRKSVIWYSNVLYWNEEKKFACRCFPATVGRAPHGATFCYKRSWWEQHKFNNNVVGEDTSFGMDAHRMQQATVFDAGTMLVVRAHGKSDSTTDRGNTCDTEKGMKGSSIPEVPVSQIPPAFFEPLLETIPECLDEYNDVVLACVQNQGWPELKTFAHSLVRAGFQGAKVLLTSGLPEDARKKLLELGFTIYQNEPRSRFVVQGRFGPAVEYLQTHRHRYAVWVDTRDLVFQTNPSLWLQSRLAPHKLVAASECWKIKDEPYNDKWSLATVGAAEHAWLREQDVCCGGTLAGEAAAVQTALEGVLRTVQSPTANDQAALNHLLRTEFKDITKFPRMRDGWTATCSAFRTQGFNGYASRPEVLTDEQPIFWKEGCVTTPGGVSAPFCVVHQYDRDPGFKNAVENRYATTKNLLLMMISTGGKYNQYLQRLIDSAREFLLPHDVLAFTDATFDLGANVKKVPYEHLGFPLASLKRYHTFLSQREHISQFRHVFYIDVDCLFVNKVADEILSPDLTAVLHPWGGFDGTSFEDRQGSTAFVDKSRKPTYYQGCFQGGTSAAFLAMAERIARNVDADMKNSIVAKYHDESHLNRYLQEHPPSRVLSTEYCFVAGQPGTPRILHYNVH